MGSTPSSDDNVMADRTLTVNEKQRRQRAQYELEALRMEIERFGWSLVPTAEAKGGRDSLFQCFWATLSRSKAAMATMAAHGFDVEADNGSIEMTGDGNGGGAGSERGSLWIGRAVKDYVNG